MALLQGFLPDELRLPLLEAHEDLRREYALRRAKYAGLDAGHFSEVALRCVLHLLGQPYPALGTRLVNLVDTARNLERLPAVAGDESLRLLIPRILVAMSEIRNRRGMGHPGGDVTANEADARVVVGNADWVLAELVRLDLAVPFAEAQGLVDDLARPATPLIQWIGNRPRVVMPEATLPTRILVLLYNQRGAIASANDLAAWTKQEGRRVKEALRRLDQQDLVDFDGNVAVLTGLGGERISEIVAEATRGRDA
jgi:hypothetical protein